MEVAWADTDEKFDPDVICGKRGYQFVSSHAIPSSNHPLVTVVTLITTMVPLTSGANIHCFPGAQTELITIVTLINHPQTRKPQMARLMKEICGCLDSHTCDALKKDVENSLRAQDRPVHV